MALEARQRFQADGVWYSPGDSFPEEVLRTPVVRSSLISQGLIAEQEQPEPVPYLAVPVEDSPPVETTEEPPPEEPEEAPPEEPKHELEAEAPEGGQPDATATAVRTAEELGVQLCDITGSGHDGKILKSDVERYAEEQSAP